uniref:oxygen-regulated protein 1 n=1 Tax=Epinephelus lanceolatus TaxID=310571 RepID=UPI001447742C|nr:oxygen-regulated protein 1 [Epinephelus lanceolatus]
MSNTPVQEPPAQELSSGSVHTLPSRPLQPTSDPSASKRVCFYKSGDYKFSGHRMVINARTFKTFDGLLDALSKKVPLPFGVRTVTTPRGTHLIKALDDLHDGGSYVCSDQKRVKPLNLDEVNRRQVPWNATRPHSAGRRRRQGSLFGQFGRRNDVLTNRPAKVTERVAVRTPKKLVVIKNRDPTVKRTIVLQRRTAPTFDALLDYLSQILQFPVLKLFSTDGRRVDGLAGLILCSGVVVAAGNEPFRLANYSFQGTGQMAQVMYMDTMEPSTLQPRSQNNKSLSSGRGSRNFSLSSERYIVNQINKSRNGSTNGHLHHHNTSFETEVNHRPTSVETRGTGRVDNQHHSCIVPQDDDIEKSFRVNQDGSMTVEMKVRLTIKEEEMLHWTTTLSRSSLRKGTVCASISESGNSSPDSNNAIAKDSSSISEDETKEENHSAGAGKCVGFNNERAYEGYASTALGKAKTGFKRTPTPGPRHVMKKASIESVKTVTESGVQESTLGHYSYMERMADGEMTEGYCVVRQSSSSNRPIPKPRKTASAGASNKGSHSSIRSSGVAEVLQIQNNGMEVTETVMHIYESQGCYDNYFANEEYSTDGVPLQGSTPAPESRPSTDSLCHSSSNDCDIDFSWQPPTTDSLQRQREEMLSLSSEPITPTHEVIATNSQTQETVKNDKTLKSETKKKMNKPARNKKASTSTSSSDKKQKDSMVTPPKSSKHSSTDKLSSNASAGKKALSSSESANGGRKSRGAEKPQIKKGEKTAKIEQALLASTENVRKTPPKRQNITKAAARDNGHNVNTPTVRPQMKKNMSDILQPKKSHLSSKKTVSKPKSMTENRTPSPKMALELTESFSMPSLNPSPAEIHQYVENWLDKVNPDPVPYAEEAITDESEPQTKVVFQIGGDSESDEKTECQSHLDENVPSPDDSIRKSASCLSVPHCHEPTTLLPSDQYMRGLCVSMPSVRVNPVYEENRLRPHKSAEAIGPADNPSSSSASNVMESRAKIKPVLRELYSSIHCIRSVCETNTTSNLEKSNSLPDFSAQVASVFGSSCKAFMSFLSVMTLRDNLSGSTPGLSSQSRSPSEAMLMLESLQKISAIEDEEELRASLTDLQSRASSQLRERWKDFQIMRERLESEPLSPRVSETEFALDVFSEGGDAFEDIDELMDELNMPEDLRAEISSTIQQAKSFYPVEESTFVETEVNQSDTEEDVEKFGEECNDETKQSPEPDTTCTAEDITTNNYFEQAKTLNESEQEPEKESEISQTLKDEPLIVKGNEKEQKEEEEQDEEDREGVTDGEDGDTKETDDDGGGGEFKETETGKTEREEEAEEGEVTEVDDKGQEISETTKGSVEEEEEEKSVQEVREGTEEEMTVDEDEEEEKLEEAEEGLMDEEVQEAREDDIIEQTEEEEERADQVGKEEKGKESTTEKRQDQETEEEADGVNEESDEGEEVGNTEVMEEEKEEADEVIGEKSEEEEEGNTEEVEEVEADEVTGEKDEGEEIGSIEEVEEEEEDEAGEVTGEKDEREEVGNTEEEGGETDADEVTGEKDDGGEVGNTEEEEGETDADEVTGEKDEGEEVGNIEEVEEGEEEEADEEGEEVGNIEEVEEGEEKEEEEEADDEDFQEEAGDGIELTEENNKEMKEVIKEIDKGDEVIEETEEEKEEEETDMVTERAVEEEVIEEEDEEDEKAGEEDEEEDKTEVVSEENDEEEEQEQEVVEDGETVEVINIEERGTTDEEEEGEDIDKNIEEEEECSEGEESGKELEKTGSSLDEESEEEKDVVEEIEIKENMKSGEMLVEEVGEDDEDNESNELNEGLDEEEEQESKDEVEQDNATDDADSITSGTDCKNVLEEASYLKQQSSEEADFDTKVAEHNTEPSTKSSEGQCEDDKGNGTDTVNELDTEDEGEPHEGGSGNLPHPVEISQELLDFVNSALQSSSLIFTYDPQGNIRIEPDKARVIQTKQIVIPKSKKDVSYGLKRLPSPSTSDLSDYRPETSESGGYKTQDSVDIVTESGEEFSSVCQRRTDNSNRRTNAERVNSNLSVASHSEELQNSQLKSGGSFSSFDSGTKASKEDLSYFSAASSQKADTEPVREATGCISSSPEKDLADGVLIDQGRWLLKENHLIRKSPPVSLGMYGQLDSTSIDTGQENNSEDSPSHCKTQHNPLVAISSSELEEMAKPQTPKCTYYNMPHGSDSDPFLDDSSVKSAKKDASSVKGRGVRVSPTIDTTKTWASKNGSLSSFASVEFKIPDRKVHPEGEPSAVTRARRTSSGGGSVLQAQDSLDTLHVRCGQYCPIL